MYTSIYFIYAQTKLHCESSELPKHCLEDTVQFYSCLGCDSWEASGIASDTVQLPSAA